MDNAINQPNPIENPDQFKEQLEQHLQRWLPIFFENYSYHEYKQIVDRVEILELRQISEHECLLVIRFHYNENAGVRWEEYRSTLKSPYERGLELREEYKETYEEILANERIALVHTWAYGPLDRNEFLALYESWGKWEGYGDPIKAQKREAMIRENKRNTRIKKRAKSGRPHLYSDFYARVNTEGNNLDIIEFATPKIPQWQNNDYSDGTGLYELDKFIARFKEILGAWQKSRYNEGVAHHTLGTYPKLENSVLVYGIFGSGKSTLVDKLDNYAGIPEEVHLSPQILKMPTMLVFEGNYFPYFLHDNVKAETLTEELACKILNYGQSLLIKAFSEVLNIDIRTRLATRMAATENIMDVALSLDIPPIHNGNLLQMLFGTLAYYKFPPVYTTYRRRSKERHFQVMNEEVETDLIKRLVSNKRIPTERELGQMIDILLRHDLRQVKELEGLDYDSSFENFKKILTEVEI